MRPRPLIRPLLKKTDYDTISARIVFWQILFLFILEVTLLLYAVLTAVLVLLDQITKYFTRANLELGQSTPFLPGFLDFTYAQNTGAAFSILQEHTWILIISSLLVIAALFYVMIRGYIRHNLGRLACAITLAGGLGNLIDRVAFGYVTDMIRTLFVDFPVFNVADCCVTIGGVLLVVYLIFYSPQDTKKEDGK